MFTAYVGSYFLLVRFGPVHAESGAWFSIEEYITSRKPILFDPHKFYRLANNLDRNLIRPSLWSGTYTLAGIVDGLQIGPTSTVGANEKQRFVSQTNRTSRAAASRPP